MYSRIVTENPLGSIEVENAEIERILTKLGYAFKAEPHPKGGLRVWFLDDIDDVDAMLTKTHSAGLRHVL